MAQVVVLSDQGAGLIKGISDTLGRAHQRRCLVHLRRCVYKAAASGCPPRTVRISLCTRGAAMRLQCVCEAVLRLVSLGA